MEGPGPPIIAFYDQQDLREKTTPKSRDSAPPPPLVPSFRTCPLLIPPETDSPPYYTWARDLGPDNPLINNTSGQSPQVQVIIINVRQNNLQIIHVLVDPHTPVLVFYQGFGLKGTQYYVHNIQGLYCTP